MKKVFIDGRSGTTGLKIYERLQSRKDIDFITLSEEERKSDEKREEAINFSDITFLCLPDDAAKEAVSFIENPNTVIIDASTAHRTNPEWLYGFPEVDKNFSEKIKTAKRVCVPGCHASGFIALVKPLIDSGLLKKDARLSCTSLTGYSGGGKKMIAEYEGEEKNGLLSYPRCYGIAQTHKHLKEMTFVSGIETPPAFMPIVAPFYSGMEVLVPIFKADLNGGKADVEKVLSEQYKGKIVSYSEENESGFLSAGCLSGKDKMLVSVFGNEERLLLCARYDNLGKGASGAAVECMNYLNGASPEEGLIL